MERLRRRGRKRHTFISTWMHRLEFHHVVYFVVYYEPEGIGSVVCGYFGAGICW